jgi:hypothetical protein
MDKKELLKKLEALFKIKELKESFKTQEDAISWANKVAPILKFVNQ